MKHIINRADIIGGLKSVKLAKKNPQYYQPGVGVSEDFELLLKNQPFKELKEEQKDLNLR